MKTRNVLIMVGVLLMSSAIFFTGCSKEEDEPLPPPDPTFVVTAQPQGDVLFFGAYCSTDDVNLTKVTIKDPLLNQFTYTAGGQLWVKNELITFPDGYNKLLGTWTFTFVGNVTADGRSFSVSATISVTGK